ncbi:MAG: helix-turn-helix transcriptional regulator [Acidobacteriota bacterium]
MARTKAADRRRAIEFGRRLRVLREERGLTQRELAERSGAQTPQISRYESGAFLPAAETLIGISKVLRVDLNALLLGERDRNPEDAIPIKDVRLLERLRELEKLDRRFRDAAVTVIDALIVQGTQEATRERLAGAAR